MASAPPPIENSDISPISIIDEMKSSYLDYAMSVIVSRALPDVRDGLKPVHRRILYACQEGGFVPGRPYRKSAKIVGDVMARLLHACGGVLPDNFSLVTLGSCIALIGNRKDSKRFHALLETVGQGDFRWLDIGSITDGA